LLFGALAGAVTLLVTFNLLHLAIRIAGVFAGYRDGEVSMVRVTRWIGPERTRLLKAATATAGGLLLGLLVFSPQDLPHTVSVLAAGACTLGAALLLTRRHTIWMVMTPALMVAILTLEITL
jgi:mannose/fructose/N-acetylgalactosamine-specific phosphotransferase system component IID